VLSNADEWLEIEMFGKAHEKWLRRFLRLEHGIPCVKLGKRASKIKKSPKMKTPQKPKTRAFAGFYQYIINKCQLNESNVHFVELVESTKNAPKALD